MPAIGSGFPIRVVVRAWFAMSLITFVGMTLSYLFGFESCGFAFFVITVVVAVAFSFQALLRVQSPSIWYAIGLHAMFWPVACVLFIYWGYMAACGQGHCL
ncbi:MAG: hypothetical protein AAGJ86_04675 [Pseudomonadota bacterium]